MNQSLHKRIRLDVPNYLTTDISSAIACMPPSQFRRNILDRLFQLRVFTMFSVASQPRRAWSMPNLMFPKPPVLCASVEIAISTPFSAAMRQ